MGRSTEAKKLEEKIFKSPQKVFLVWLKRMMTDFKIFFEASKVFFLEDRSLMSLWKQHSWG